MNRSTQIFEDTDFTTSKTANNTALEVILIAPRPTSTIPEMLSKPDAAEEIDNQASLRCLPQILSTTPRSG